MLNSYKYDYKDKNYRLINAAKTLKKNKNIVAVVYFNRDKTDWLTHKVSWELDWAAFDYRTNKIYKSYKEFIINKYENKIDKTIWKLWYKNAIIKYKKILKLKTKYKNNKIDMIILNYYQNKLINYYFIF